MKKMFLMIGLLFFTVSFALFAQDPVPPESWTDVFADPGKWFVSFGAVSLLTAFLASFFNGVLKIVKKFPRQLVAWVVAILLLVVSSLLNFGYAAEFPLTLAVTHGFAAGLAANGWFDVPTLNAILKAIEGWFKPKE